MRIRSSRCLNAAHLLLSAKKSSNGVIRRAGAIEPRPLRLSQGVSGGSLAHPVLLAAKHPLALVHDLVHQAELLRFVYCLVQHVGGSFSPAGLLHLVDSIVSIAMFTTLPIFLFGHRTQLPRLYVSCLYPSGSFSAWALSVDLSANPKE
jgi:hypothetical protein